MSLPKRSRPRRSDERPPLKRQPSDVQPLSICGSSVATFTSNSSFYDDDEEYEYSISFCQDVTIYNIPIPTDDQIKVLYYTEDQIAEFRYENFMESCGLSATDFEEYDAPAAATAAELSPIPASPSTTTGVDEAAEVISPGTIQAKIRAMDRKLHDNNNNNNNNNGSNSNNSILLSPATTVEFDFKDMERKRHSSSPITDTTVGSSDPPPVGEITTSDENINVEENADDASLNLDDILGGSDIKLNVITPEQKQKPKVSETVAKLLRRSTSSVTEEEDMTVTPDDSSASSLENSGDTSAWDENEDENANDNHNEEKKVEEEPSNPAAAAAPKKSSSKHRRSYPGLRRPSSGPRVLPSKADVTPSSHRRRSIQELNDLTGQGSARSMISNWESKNKSSPSSSSDAPPSFTIGALKKPVPVVKKSHKKKVSTSDKKKSAAKAGNNELPPKSPTTPTKSPSTSSSRRGKKKFNFNASQELPPAFRHLQKSNSCSSLPAVVSPTPPPAPPLLETIYSPEPLTSPGVDKPKRHSSPSKLTRSASAMSPSTSSRKSTSSASSPSPRSNSKIKLLLKGFEARRSDVSSPLGTTRKKRNSERKSSSSDSKLPSAPQIATGPSKSKTGGSNKSWRKYENSPRTMLKKESVKVDVDELLDISK